MRFRAAWIYWTVLSISGAALARPTRTFQPNLPKVRGTRAAIKLTYHMTDDEGLSLLSDVMLSELDKLPQRKGDNTHNIVFRDGSTPDDSRLYYLRGGPPGVGPLGTPVAPGRPEVTSNDPKVLSDVVRLAFSRYSGRRRYLHVFSHGGGASGLGTDDLQVDEQGRPRAPRIPLMPVRQFAQALRTGLQGRQLDLIYMNACMMGNLEALYELRGIARFAMASEAVSWAGFNSEFQLPDMLDEMASRGVAPREIARQLAIKADGRRGYDSDFATAIAVDIERLTDLKSSLNRLLLSLKAALPKHRAAIVQAYDEVPAINDLTAPYGMRDLWAFTAALQRRVPDPSVQRELGQVRKAQREATVHERDGLGSHANGLSIFMPARTEISQWLHPRGRQAEVLGKQRYGETRFAKDTGWDEFLESMSAVEPIASR